MSDEELVHPKPELYKLVAYPPNLESHLELGAQLDQSLRLQMQALHLQRARQPQPVRPEVRR